MNFDFLIISLQFSKFQILKLWPENIFVKKNWFEIVTNLKVQGRAFFRNRPSVLHFDMKNNRINQIKKIKLKNMVGTSSGAHNWKNAPREGKKSKKKYAPVSIFKVNYFILRLCVQELPINISTNLGKPQKKLFSQWPGH